MDLKNKVTKERAQEIEEETRNQAQSRVWFTERQMRLTSSTFGDICKATERRDYWKLCKSLFDCKPLNLPAITHGKESEPKALKCFSEKFGLTRVNFRDPSRTRNRKASSFYYQSLAEKNGFVEGGAGPCSNGP